MAGTAIGDSDEISIAFGGVSEPRLDRGTPRSVEREVVRVLVATRPLELDLHQHVVEQ